MDDGSLLTDLYQLTMLQSYFDQGMNDEAVFEFVVRKLPERRNFLLAGGLEQIVEYLENLHFTPADLSWLADCGRFHARFVDSLTNLRFTGAVEAIDEGTVFFPHEPILRVIAPLREAQLIETRIINLLQFQTLIASRAARVRLAAPGKLLIDSGLRRAHGAEAGLYSARASFLGGFDGTATVLAGMRWNIPLFGSMAHSFVHNDDNDENELAAFASFARTHPKNATLLIDKCNIEASTHAVVTVARKLEKEGISLQAVRIDNGDPGRHAQTVRRILDAGGLPQLRILVSGNLDEYSVLELVSAGAPIDSFCVDTRLNNSAGQPFLDCAYKLQEYAGRPRHKRVAGHPAWPGRKQIFRHLDKDGKLLGDMLALAGEQLPGQALLHPVMHGGRRLSALPPLATSRQGGEAQLATLPPALRNLNAHTGFPLGISAALRELAGEVDQFPA